MFQKPLVCGSLLARHYWLCRKKLLLFFFFNYLFTFPLADSLGATSERDSMLGAGLVPMAFAQGEG